MAKSGEIRLVKEVNKSATMGIALDTLIDLEQPRWPLKVDQEGKNSLRKTLDGQVDSGMSTAIGGHQSGDIQAPFRFAGLLATLMASVFFSFSILFVKMLPEYDGFAAKAQVIFFRGLIMMVLCSVNLICTRTTFLVRRDELLVNVLRAVFATLGIFGVYCALNYISTGDATAIVFSSPIWTSILSYFILGEPLQWIHLVALPASLFGIVLIAHPTLVVPAECLLVSPPMLKEFSASLSVLPADDLDDGPQLGAHFDLEHRWPGIVIALLTSVAVAASFIVFKCRQTTAIQTSTFWVAAFMCAFGATLMCCMGDISLPTSTFHWLLLIANGLFSWLGQSILQWAFTYEQAGLLSIVRTSDVAVTFVLSATLLDETIVWTSILGAATIIGVVVSIVLNNWLQTLPCCFTGTHEWQTNVQLLEISIANANGNTIQHNRPSILHEKCSSASSPPERATCTTVDSWTDANQVHSLLIS